MNFLPNLTECYFSFIPVRHLESAQEGQNLSNFLVIFFNVLGGYIKILFDLLYHLISDIVKLNWLHNNTTNVNQPILLFVRVRCVFQLIGNPVDSFDDINHILEGILDILFKIFFIGVKSHLFLSDTDVEKSSFPLFSHFLYQHQHRIVVGLNQSFNHNIVNKFDKVR